MTLQLNPEQVWEVIEKELFGVIGCRSCYEAC
jgi:hypothetical protein